MSSTLVQHFTGLPAVIRMFCVYWVSALRVNLLQYVLPLFNIGILFLLKLVWNYFFTGENQKDAYLHFDPAVLSGCIVGCQIYSSSSSFPVCSDHDGAITTSYSQIHFHTGRITWGTSLTSLDAFSVHLVICHHLTPPVVNMIKTLIPNQLLWNLN